MVIRGNPVRGLVSAQGESSRSIERIELRKIYDSRGNPTVEAEITLEGGYGGRASSPSGASTGATEVRSFPSGGVDEAIRRTAERLAPRLRGFETGRQGEFDHRLKEADGTDDFSFLGGNVATALSLAYAAATAKARGVPLWAAIAGDAWKSPRVPGLVGNVMNGGVHAVGGPAIQEFIAFVEAPTAREEVEAAIAVHREVGRKLRKLFPTAALGRGDEGGWVAPLEDEKALEVLAEACQDVAAPLKGSGVTIRPGLDLAASELFKEGKYHYKGRALSVGEQVDFVSHLIERFGLAYVEDPFDEADFASFAALTQRFPKGPLIVGDDLYTTNPARVRRGIEERASNAVLLKVNQVGTLTDTLTTAELAGKAGWSTVVSHRSGETPDAWLSHVAYAIAARGLKCGVLGGERIAKLNELVRIAGDA